MNILVNLPAGFFTAPAVAPHLARLALLGDLRRRSWNTPDEIRADLAWADAVVMWSWPVLDESLLAAAPRLRFVGHIDLARRGAAPLLARGLAVSCSRRCWSPAVAEMALALTLATLRRLSAHHAAMRRGGEAWVRAFPDDIDPRERELTGRPVGIVGFGAVGRRFAELLAPFRCQVRVHDPFLPAAVAAEAGVEAVVLDDLLAASDVVVLCAAANTGTARLLDARRIALLRPGAVLVNVARAALVDTAALTERLARGDLDAAVDVFDEEPLPATAALRQPAGAWLTPHRAGGTLAAVERSIAWLVDDLEAHRSGRPLRHPLVPAMLPGLDD